MSIQFLVDWDKDGNFTGIYDNITADVQSASWSLGARSPFQFMCDEPVLTLTLKNIDGKYSPENSGSVIAGKLRPYTRIRVIETVTNTPLWNGYLDFPQVKWSPMATYTGRDSVTLNCVGAKQLLDRITISQPTFEDETADVIIQDALERAGVYLLITEAWILGVVGSSELGVTTRLGSAGIWRTFDTGITVFPRVDGARDNVWDIITALTVAERGRFYIDRDGKYIWKNRHHTYLNDDAGYALSDNLQVGMDYYYGDLLANSITVKSQPRSTLPSEQLWNLENPINIGAGSVIRIEATLRRPTGQFARATSLTKSESFSSGSATITVTPNGGVATIEINNTTASNATLATLVLSGVPSYDQNALTVLVEDADSITDYGKREKSFSVGNLTGYDDLNGIAYMELLRLPMRGRVASFSLIAEDDGVQNAMLFEDFAIGDFLEIDATATLYHEGRYIVIGEEHNWERGGVHRARYFVEPVRQAGMIFDVVGRMEFDTPQATFIY